MAQNSRLIVTYSGMTIEDLREIVAGYKCRSEIEPFGQRAVVVLVPAGQEVAYAKRFNAVEGLSTQIDIQMATFRPSAGVLTFLR